MATTFDSSVNGNALRQSFMASTNASMADTLPNINFGFDDLRDRMAKFTARFDQFIAEGRKRVLEERNQFRSQVAELQGNLDRSHLQKQMLTAWLTEDKKMKQRAIDILSQQSQSHAQTIAKEAAETDDMQAAIASITNQRDERARQRDRLKGEIASNHKGIAQRLEAQRKHAAEMDEQARLNNPELDFWVDYLCLRIEGTRTDHLKFVFTHVDERDWDKEFWFELSMAQPEYEVVDSRPRLDRERVDLCLERFNESRDVGAFLKDMRGLFVDSLK